MKNLRVYLVVLMASIAPSLAFAGHIGGYLGPSIFMNSTNNSAFFTGGVDAALELIPTFELGAFYHHVSVTNSAMTQVGAEVNLYPLLFKTFYVGAKLGNANQSSVNRVTYGPAAGLNFDFTPGLTFGVDGDYFFYSGTSMSDLTLLGSFKIWF